MLIQSVTAEGVITVLTCLTIGKFVLEFIWRVPPTESEHAEQSFSPDALAGHAADHEEPSFAQDVIKRSPAQDSSEIKPRPAKSRLLGDLSASIPGQGTEVQRMLARQNVQDIDVPEYLKGSIENNYRVDPQISEKLEPSAIEKATQQSQSSQQESTPLAQIPTNMEISHVDVLDPQNMSPMDWSSLNADISASLALDR